MRIISLSSIGESTEIALMLDGQCVEVVGFPSSHTLSEVLWGALEALLLRHQVVLADIDGFAAVRGPGTYTALRVGLTALSGLAWALDKPAIGFTVDEIGEASDYPESTLAEGLACRCASLAHRHWLVHPPTGYHAPLLPEYGSELRIGQVKP